jgi:arylsulfatase A-like enzyme
MIRLSVLYFLAALGVTQVAASTRPNVVVILTDDQGWGDLSHHGNSNLETPNIDRLARQGADFRRFYVSPICSPTRAELLTGRYSPRGGVISASQGEERLDLDETTIADIFHASGYRTAAFGKWHNGMQPPYHPNARGFEEFYGFCSGHWGHYFDPVLENNGKIVQGKGFIVDDLTNRAMDYMEKHRAEPFFVYLSINTPHSPMQVPDHWWDKFKDKELALLSRESDPESIPHTRAALAMCENIDWNVGRVMEKLDDLELAGNTIVLYLSDNGPNGFRWNGGMKGRKGTVDEGGVRVPFFIRWPGRIQAGIIIPEIAGAIDLLATLTDLADIDKYQTLPLDGISLKPLLLQKGDSWPERLYFNYFNGRTSVRSQRFRLDDRGSLFDMNNDPGQQLDVSEQFPEIAEQLRGARKNFVEKVASELPRKDDRPFTLGHPDFEFTQIPARDGIPHGNVQRSGRAPNDSYFTNWTNEADRITWDVEVLSAGDYRVELYYTCPQEDLGSTIELRHGDTSIRAQVTEANDPPLRGAEADRVRRRYFVDGVEVEKWPSGKAEADRVQVGESYVKDFKPLDLGIIPLKEGRNPLTLRALKVAGNEVMDVKFLMFTRVSPQKSRR